MKRFSAILVALLIMASSVVVFSACSGRVLVTFESNGGSAVSTLKVKKGGLINQPESPTKTDFVFDGWFLDSQFDQRWNFGEDKPSADVVLYARWATKGLDFELINNDKEYSLRSLGTAESTEIVVPYRFEGKAVTQVSDNAFYRQTYITRVDLPHSITKIGDSAFSDCIALNKITMPKNLTAIGNFAFSYCTGLTEISIPDKVRTIGVKSFYRCTGIVGIVVPQGVTSIGEEAFGNCVRLIWIFIPASVSDMGSRVFADSYRLEVVHIEILLHEPAGWSLTWDEYCPAEICWSCSH